MLTATLSLPGSSGSHVSNQNETLISDAEISARVLRIRSGWTVAERVERRREAERRFADLINSIEAI